jgi:hypothetical protein
MLIDSTKWDGDVEGELDRDIVDRLDIAHDLMVKADAIGEQMKDLEERRDKLKEEAEEVLAPIHIQTGLRGVTGPWGTMTFYIGKQKRLDKAKLQRILVTEGVKLSVVQGAINSATKTTENKKLTIQYKPVIEE